MAINYGKGKNDSDYDLNKCHTATTRYSIHHSYVKEQFCHQGNKRSGVNSPRRQQRGNHLSGVVYNKI